MGFSLGGLLGGGLGDFLESFTNSSTFGLTNLLGLTDRKSVV